jgi:hypothetical protein
MPGWYVHLDVARQALPALASNNTAAAQFAAAGPSAANLTAIARRNPAYAALGAIGPDTFFLLPDFKPPFGQMLWGAADFIKSTYEWWDDNFLSPYEDQLQPIAMNFTDEINALSGGLVGQISAISSRAMTFLHSTLESLVLRQYDFFGLLGSGVPSGYDEQVFFWSDMLRYRKTYQFAAHLWHKATVALNASTTADDRTRNERHQAFALGWMTHLAADVTGHCFVNEKAGGPYRLHWQRHHLIENHMDARVYDSEHGSQSTYQMLSCAALHLWLAFEGDGSSHTDFFAPQPSPTYSTDANTGGVLNRRRIWDVDSTMPDDLGRFISEALTEVYTNELTGTATPLGQCAAHPTILQDTDPGSFGYVSQSAVQSAYWWLYHYSKVTTTDFFSLLRPEAPAVLSLPQFPSPPGAGVADAPPDMSDDNFWHDFLEVVLAIFGWILYLTQIAVWLLSLLPTLIASGISYPIRELLYDYVELPLYNAWQAVHWYMSMTGFVYPMQNEIDTGMVTLGSSSGDVLGTIRAALNDLDGGLRVPAAVPGTEPSGAPPAPRGPIEVVEDDPGLIAEIAGSLPLNACVGGPSPSEFVRPWLWPSTNNAGVPVQNETPPTVAGPYVAGQDATILMGHSPGNNAARTEFENARCEADTQETARNHLPVGSHMGDPVDYAAYVIAWLTRDVPHSDANFNLDADRGYGYLCWDWLRSSSIMAVPLAWSQWDSLIGPVHHRIHQIPPPPEAPSIDTRAYHAPVRPGKGWCHQDQAVETPSPVLPPAGNDVRIRYIDRENKYGV